MRRWWLTFSLVVGLQVQATDTLTVTFTGDVLLDRGVRVKISTDGVESLFSPSVDSLFAHSDVVVGNLECPVTDIRTPMQKVYQGRRGLIDTRRRVAEAGMVPIGAGATMDEAAQPVLLAEAPRKVWMVASLRLALENYAYLPSRPCVSQESFDALLARVRRLRADDPSCYIVVSLHWGGENTMHPLLQQVADAHRLIDAGADLLVGHHPHTLQDVEVYHGKHIFYSIGNFIFDLRKPQHSKAAVVVLRLSADDAIVDTLPVEINDCVPTICL